MSDTPPSRPDVEVRKGQVPQPLTREEFGKRFQVKFYDPAYLAESAAIARLEEIAWNAHTQERKSPITMKIGAGHADPDYDVSVQWRDTAERLKAAQERWADRASPSRVLIICGSARNDATCPGENSKTWRFAELARQIVEQEGMQADLLDLSLVTSEYGRNIHPCKGCVSTAMPLCHWPCSCYPNHSLGQAEDWMAEIYERWVAAHGIIIAAPTYWYQSPSPLKLMIDRLVCADGGNPDPSSTHGKKAVEAKRIEQNGWDYPKHMAGRVFGLIVHGDVAGVESQRRNLGDWLQWMGLIQAGRLASLDRYIGYYQPYFDSHDTLDKDELVQEEARNVARSVSAAVAQMRAGTLEQPDRQVVNPRPK